jgi:hypothetical protein
MRDTLRSLKIPKKRLIKQWSKEKGQQDQAMVDKTLHRKLNLKFQ